MGTAWLLLGAICAVAGGIALFAVFAVLLSPLRSLSPDAPEAFVALLLAVNGAIAAIGARRHLSLGIGYVGFFAVLILGAQSLLNSLTSDYTIPPFNPDLRPIAILVAGFAITYAGSVGHGYRATASYSL